MMMESPVGFTHHLTDVLAHGRHSMNICGIIASPTRGVFFFFLIYLLVFWNMSLNKVLCKIHMDSIIPNALYS